MADKTFAGSDEAYKALRTLYRANARIRMSQGEVSLQTLYELEDFGCVTLNHELSPRWAEITDYGRRVYFQCETPEGCKE